MHPSIQDVSLLGVSLRCKRLTLALTLTLENQAGPLSGLALSLVICDEVTKFVTVETTSMTNKWNVTTKSS
jgi:hypothetical protein